MVDASDREERTHVTVTGEPSVVGETERYLELYRTMVLIRGIRGSDPVALPAR